MFILGLVLGIITSILIEQNKGNKIKNTTLENRVWLSPPHKNIGVKKSFQVGDGVGNDTLFVNGVIVLNGNVLK